MAHHNHFPPTYFILLLITITRLISTDQHHKPLLLLLPPPLSQHLRDDPESLRSASGDYGNLVNLLPLAVFRPSSVLDVAGLVRASYESPVPFRVAARGQGHSTRGQATTRGGVVVEMKALREVKNINENNNNKNHKNKIGVLWDPMDGSWYGDVGGEQLWVDVLHETLRYGLAPPSWTDYLYLTVGGTLSNAGIGGQTFRYGPQISNVREMDVITGM